MERISEEHVEAFKELFDLEVRMTKVAQELGIGSDDPQALQEETPRVSSGAPLVQTNSDADENGLTTIDEFIATFYESTSYPLGGVPNLDRFRSLFVPNAQLVRVEKDNSYLTDINGFISSWHEVLARGSIQAVSEVETGRRTSKLGNVAHVISTSEVRSVENGHTKHARQFYSLHLAEVGGRWCITSMHWGITARDDEPAQQPVAPA